MRVLDRRNAGQISSYAAAGGGVFVLSGQTALFRASAIRDDGGECLEALLADEWEGIWGLLRHGPRSARLKQNENCDTDYAVGGHGYFHKQKLDTGDDAFLTRWVQERLGLEIVVQGLEAAACLTRVASDRRFASQLLRWERSTIQTFLRCAAGELHSSKGKLWHGRRYMLRKMVERLTRPLLTWFHIWAWWRTANDTPLIA